MILLIEEIVNYSPSIEVPKASISIKLPGGMAGLEIARMLENRLGKKIEFREFRTLIVNAFPDADTAITSRGQKIDAGRFYCIVCIDITTGYGRAIDAMMLAEMVSKIAVCPN